MSSYRFDLEKAVAAWRRPFEHNRAFSSEDLAELESSLRDRVYAMMEAGLSEEAAFNISMKVSTQELPGTIAAVEKVYESFFPGTDGVRNRTLFGCSGMDRAPVVLWHT